MAKRISPDQKSESHPLNRDKRMSVPGSVGRFITTNNEDKLRHNKQGKAGNPQRTEIERLKKEIHELKAIVGDIFYRQVRRKGGAWMHDNTDLI